jgi:hypothetical protein
MSFRLTGILALCAALLAGLILFWDRDDESTRASLEQARRAFRFDPVRVDRLAIESGGLAIECQLRGRQWHLVRPIAARADAVAIARLLGALQELPRGEIILPSRRAENPYAPYGLDAPRASIAVMEGIRTNRILVGRRTPLGDGVYVRQAQQPGLARIPSVLLDLIPASADALRDRSLLAGAPASIERLDLRGPAGYIQLARDSAGVWRMFQPATARADPAIVSALIEKLLSCSVVQFVQDAVGDLSPYGLESRTAVIAVLNTDSGDGSQMLAFGEALPNDPALVYARLQAENSVYAVPAEVRQALLVKPDDLRDRRIPGTDFEAIGRVRVEEGEAVLEFFRDADGRWELAAPVRVPAESAAIQELLRSWADVRLSAFESPPPGHGPPLTRSIRIEPLRQPAPPVELRLGPNPDQPGTCRIAIHGDSTLALATPSRLLDFPLDPLAYRSREILTVPAADIAAVKVAARGQTLQAERDPASGQWPPAAASWLDPLLAALAPLRAEALLAEGPQAAAQGFENPFLTLTLQRRGQGGLATLLLVGDELAPGGPRRATLRGRNLVFALSPLTLEALAPEPLPPR